MENKYNIIDTHSHYDSEDYNEDREEVLTQIQEAGVVGILNCASSYDSIAKTLTLTQKYEFIYGALGIHPSNADELTQERLIELKSLIKENKSKVIAVGEIGLDYYWDENPSKEIQKEAFRNQMKLAEELNLPVVIHDRDAHNDTLEILKEFPTVIGVVHCFSGSVEFAKQCTDLGYYIGITGVVTFKNAKKIKDVVKAVSLDRLLVETDCPYMAPVPNRGKRNKSDYIQHIIEEIAQIKEIEPISLNIQLNDNFSRLIGQKI
ncbi:MAG: TatD family hydrolase [Clostridium sp.]